MKTIKELIKELKELKKNGVTEDDISTIKDIIIDYENDSQNWDFDSLENQMVHYDSVMEAIKWKADQYDLWGVQQLVEGLDKADWYIDKGDYFDNIEKEDVEEWLDDIISLAKDLLTDQK